MVFYFNLRSCIHFPWDHQEFDWELLNWLAVSFNIPKYMLTGTFQRRKGNLLRTEPLAFLLHSLQWCLLLFWLYFTPYASSSWIHWTFWSWHFLEMFSSVAFLHHNYLMRFLQLSTITGEGSFVSPQTLIITCCVRHVLLTGDSHKNETVQFMV